MTGITLPRKLITPSTKSGELGDVSEFLKANDFLDAQNIETELLVSNLEAHNLEQTLSARVRLIEGDDLGLNVVLAHALFLFTPRFGPTRRRL
jgi:hypothetical protein